MSIMFNEICIYNIYTIYIYIYIYIHTHTHTAHTHTHTQIKILEKKSAGTQSQEMFLIPSFTYSFLPFQASKKNTHITEISLVRSNGISLIERSLEASKTDNNNSDIQSGDLTLKFKTVTLSHAPV